MIIEASAEYIKERLHDDQLGDLIQTLQNNGAIIAGSYNLPTLFEQNVKNDERLRYQRPCEEHVFNPDIDIWIPFHKTNQNIKMANIMGILLNIGYKYPHKYRNSGNWLGNDNKVPDAYKRIHEMISTMLTFTHDTLRSVQVILLSKKGGSSFQDVVKHFDLTLTQTYFDGNKLFYLNNDVEQDISSKTICINTKSNIIKNQSFPEWCRTLTRVLKYSNRGYKVSEGVKNVFETFAQSSLFSSGRWMGSRINIESYITEWNHIVECIAKTTLRLPRIGLSLLPPGQTTEHVIIGFVENSIVKQNGVSNYDVKHYNHLTQKELSYMKPLPNVYDDDSLDYIRNLHISQIVPYPELNTRTNVEFDCSSLPTECFNVFMVEDTDIRTYLEEDTDDHFVFYTKLKNKDTIVAYGVHRDLLTAARTFLPCSDINSPVRNTHITRVALHAINVGNHSFNIPSKQINTILGDDNIFRKFIVNVTKFEWKRSRLEHIVDFVGGPANFCGEHTSKRISFLEHLVNCQ
jgi:hypothetical protein